MFLLIDNYDSFTFNLAQAFLKLGKRPIVIKNDDPYLLEAVKDKNLEMVCVSPGPGRPEQAGLVHEFLNMLPPDIPVLGICLGHQILGQHAGAEIEIAPQIMHGKQSDIEHDAAGLFQNLATPMTVGRYHSLVVKETPESKKFFYITAKGPEGEIMGLQYRDRPWVGVQFHPESVLTPEGEKFLANFPDTLLPKEPEIEFTDILKTLSSRINLTSAMAQQAFAKLMNGELTTAQIAAFLTLMHAKGESPEEVAAAIKAVLKRAVPVPGIEYDCIDVVGTGGDGKNSFNCSTATALVLAGMGYKVAKHGNRAASSKCGAADALEGLGIELDSEPANVAKMLEKRNFAFLFAPHFHPAFKHVGPTRKELGIPTLFNILGPMINPARPSHLLMGVAKPELIPVVADALVHSGLRKGAIVCGAGGYDELTPLGPSRIAIIKDEEISWLEVDPARYGIFPCEEKELSCSSKEEAINILKDLLRGKGPKPMQDMVILNTGVAIYLLKDNITLEEAMDEAKNGVKGGKGIRVIENA